VSMLLCTSDRSAVVAAPGLGRQGPLAIPRGTAPAGRRGRAPGRRAMARAPAALVLALLPAAARAGAAGLRGDASPERALVSQDPDLVHPPPCGDTPSNSCGGDPGTMCFADPTCLVFAGPGCNAGGTSQVCRYCDVGGGTPECEPESPAKANAALGPVVDTGTAAVGTPATTLDGSAASKRSLVAARRGSQPDPGNSEIQHERSSATMQAWRRDSSWAPGDKGAPHSVTIGDDAMPTVTLEARLLSRGSAGIQKPLPAP